jgi:hypothetical protein
MRTEDEWVNSPRKSSHATRVAAADHSFSEKAANFIEKFPPFQADLEGRTSPASTHSSHYWHRQFAGQLADLVLFRKLFLNQHLHSVPISAFSRGQGYE